MTDNVTYINQSFGETGSDDLPNIFPPCGLLRDVAAFIHQQARYPIPEVSLAAAMGLMGGIVGGAFQTPTYAGLNIYVLAVAETGVGKEAGREGVNLLVSAVSKTTPAIKKFIGPGDFSSMQGIRTHLAKTSPCFVSMIGEVGLKLQQMTAKNAPPYEKGKARMLLDLYGASSANNIFHGASYSKQEDNIEDIQSPSLTLYGESTPHTIFGTISENFVDDGLLPRFLILELKGPWPKRNKNRNREPSPDVIEQLRALCAHSADNLQQEKYTFISITDEAKARFEQVEDEARDYAEKAKDSRSAKMFTRSALRALKLASLCAVGVNPNMPTVTLEMFDWAIRIEGKATKNIADKIDRGETGDQSRNDNAQINKVREVMEDWINKEWTALESYKCGNETIHYARIIPHSYISKRLTPLPIFRNSPIGATKAIKNAIEALIENGEYAVRHVPVDKNDPAFGSKAKYYVRAQENENFIIKPSTKLNDGDRMMPPRPLPWHV